MLYWLGVYALVVIAVLLPLLLLFYMMAGMLWLMLAAIRSFIRVLRSVLVSGSSAS
jgi:hypothetical protein